MNDALDHALNFESGLERSAAGRAGRASSKTRAEAGDPSATFRTPLEHRVAGAIAAMAVAAGGIDALVFTAGIGEDS